MVTLGKHNIFKLSFISFWHVAWAYELPRNSNIFNTGVIMVNVLQFILLLYGKFFFQHKLNKRCMCIECIILHFTMNLFMILIASKNFLDVFNNVVKLIWSCVVFIHCTITERFMNIQIFLSVVHLITTHTNKHVHRRVPC